jgi:hypothetical protein
MKTRSLSRFRPLYYFQEHKRIKSGLSVFLAIAFLNLSTGCSYYRVKTIPPQDYKETAQQIKAFNEADKYIILHKNNASLHLSNPIVNEDNLELSGTVSLLSDEHNAKRIIEPGRSYRYKPNETHPMNEIHIFLKEGEPLSLDNTIIPIDDIQKIGIVNNDAATSVVYVTLGVLGTLVLILAVYAALKSSCPFIYVHNGEDFVFSGELYPGNIIKNAQQTDYLPLPALKNTNGVYTIQITNELLEIQHTDLAQLLVVSHPKNTRALTDNNGDILVYQNLESPLHTVMDGKIKNSQPGQAKDGSSFMFDSPKQSYDSKRNVVFTFKKPVNQKEAKLYITAKNSLWLDYVFGKFNEKFGIYYNKFQKNQQETTAEEALAWAQEQNIPLTISIKRNGVWKEVEKLSSVGPLSYRDLGIKLDLEGIDEEEIEVKLETGYMFWEVDYVAIDYSENLPYKVTLLDPELAITNTGQNVTNLLTSQDGQYLTQEQVGDKVEITYRTKSFLEDVEYSYFLKNRGYYTYIRDYEGIPDFVELQKFRDPNTFTRFSENEYHRILKAFQLKKESYVVQ